jgi:arabinogalactan endo-1,4-beta-galactosidase
MAETSILRHAATELSKAGVLFLIMGLGLYGFWTKIEQQDREVRKELADLREQTKDCSNKYQALLLEQVKKTTEVIDRNTDVLLTLRR